jgi:hypothetical protein
MSKIGLKGLKFARGEKKLARAKIDEKKVKNLLADSRARRDASRRRSFELNSGKPSGEFACTKVARRQAKLARVFILEF